MPENASYAVEIRYNARLPVRDGLELSANLFLPIPRHAGERFPAILEMIPYRKDDWRYCADHQRMTYFAQRGYVGCRLDVRGTGSSVLAAHRIRLSLASASWPVIWPSPYPADNALHRGPTTPSRLILPVVPWIADTPAPPDFKTSPPELIEVGSGSDEPAIWRIVEDVIQQTTTVRVYGGDTSVLPDGQTSLFTSELLEMTASERDPAHVRLYNEVNYRLKEHGSETHVRTSGTVRSTTSDFHVDLELRVALNGNTFFQESWLESVPRRLL